MPRGRRYTASIGGMYAEPRDDIFTFREADYAEKCTLCTSYMLTSSADRAASRWASRHAMREQDSALAEFSEKEYARHAHERTICHVAGLSRRHYFRATFYDEAFRSIIEMSNDGRGCRRHAAYRLQTVRLR